MGVRQVRGFNAFKGGYTISGLYQNPAQYLIEFFKLFRFLDKNSHNHSWFFTWFLEMKYLIFLTFTKPIDI
jgi:hypothetical protein